MCIYIFIYNENHNNITRGGGGCGIVINEFELQPPYNVHFWTNIQEKSKNSLIILAMS